jgi:hypothetical protein
MPMVFDNIIDDRTLEQAHAEASFTDPYIGRDAGYLQVTRLSGKGPALLVLPDAHTPLEAYVPLPNPRASKPGAVFTERSQRSQTSEGFYDWTVASKGYAENEWKDAGEQWNTPTSITLAPGESRSIGVRFVEAPHIRAIEDTLAANHRPVAVGIAVPEIRQQGRQDRVASAGRFGGDARRLGEGLGALRRARDRLGAGAADRDLCRRHGADRQLRHHQAARSGDGRYRPLHDDEAMV